MIVTRSESDELWGPGDHDRCQAVPKRTVAELAESVAAPTVGDLGAGESAAEKPANRERGKGKGTGYRYRRRTARSETVPQLTVAIIAPAVG